MAYRTFDQMKSELAGKPGVTNPAGLAAFIGRKKYGKGQFDHAAATGHSLRHAKKKGKHHAQIAKFVKRHHKGA
jgi:hypothetical protein